MNSNTGSWIVILALGLYVCGASARQGSISEEAWRISMGDKDYGAHEELHCRKEAPVKYPSKARRMGIGGEVLYRIQVDSENRFLGAVIQRSSGNAELDAAGLKAVSRWCFHAGQKNGKPVGGEVLVPVHFNPW